MRNINLNNKFFYNLYFILTILFFCFLFIYLNFIQPRPYYLTLFTDVENDYFYNAKLLYNNYPVESVFHPGSIVFFISSIIFHITGDNIDNSQFFFTYNYLFIIALNLAAFLYSINYLYKISKSILPYLFFSFSIFAWPSYLVYLDRLSADAYIGPISIFLSIKFFKLIENKEFKLNKILMLSVLSGLGLAIKLNILPVVLIISLYFFLFGDNKFFSFSLLKNNLKYLLNYLIFTFVGFIIFFLPSLNLANIKKLIIIFYPRLLANDTNDISILDQFYYSIKNSNFFIFTLFILIILFIYHSKSIIDKKINLIFLFFFSILTFFYYLTSVDLYSYLYDGSHTLHFYNYRQGICIIPFLLLSFFKIINIEEKIPKSKKLFNVFSITVLFLILFNFIIYIDYRKNLVLKHKNFLRENQNFVINNFQDKTIALWLEQPSPIDLGSVSFHNWGNYKYSKLKFTNSLEKKYSKISMMYPVNKENKVVDFNFSINDIDIVIIHNHHLKNKFDLSIGEFIKILSKEYKINSWNYDKNIYVINLKKK